MPRKALVVDDEHHLLNLIREMLEISGWIVETHDNGPDALAFVQAHEDVDLLICDLNMRPMRGTELIAAVRATRPFTRIIAISGELKGVRHQLVSESAIVPGADIFLPKPFNFSEMELALGLLFRE